MSGKFKIIKGKKEQNKFEKIQNNKKINLFNLEFDKRNKKWVINVEKQIIFFQDDAQEIMYCLYEEDYQEVERIGEKVIQKMDGNFLVYNSLIYVYDMKDKNEKILDLIDNVVGFIEENLPKEFNFSKKSLNIDEAMSLEFFKFYSIAAHFYYRFGKIDKAEEILLKMISLESDNYFANKNFLLKCWLKKDEYQKILDYKINLIEEKDYNYELMFLKMISAHKLKNEKEFSKYLEILIKLNPFFLNEIIKEVKNDLDFYKEEKEYLEVYYMIEIFGEKFQDDEEFKTKILNKNNDIIRNMKQVKKRIEKEKIEDEYQMLKMKKTMEKVLGYEEDDYDYEEDYFENEAEDDDYEEDYFENEADENFVNDDPYKYYYEAEDRRDYSSEKNKMTPKSIEHYKKSEEVIVKFLRNLEKEGYAESTITNYANAIFDCNYYHVKVKRRVNFKEEVTNIGEYLKEMKKTFANSTVTTKSKMIRKFYYYLLENKLIGKKDIEIFEKSFKLEFEK